MARWPAFSNLSTRRIKLVVSYDGTDFCGWAPQAGRRSVQSTLTEAIRRVSGENIEIIGASRTDAGAHAAHQVCHFDTGNPMPVQKWIRALNDVLDADIAVQEAHKVSEAFHSRFSARYRWYRYRIVHGTRSPLTDRFSYNDWRQPDRLAMAEAGQGLIGRHDFRAFTAELQPWLTNTYRKLLSIEVDGDERETWIDIKGTAFMRGMMRRIVGGMFEVGIGRRPASDLAALTTEEGMTRLDLPVVLPAKGLMLMHVEYGKRLRDIREKQQEEENE
jgi:tRNA pseudouridine38-40 synthase